MKLFRFIFLSDKVAPTFDFCPADDPVQLQTDLGEPTRLYRWLNPMAHDNYDEPTITCNYASGTNFSIGTTSINCVAMDSRRNQETCQFIIDVRGISFLIIISEKGDEVKGLFPEFSIMFLCHQ